MTKEELSMVFSDLENSTESILSIIRLQNFEEKTKKELVDELENMLLAINLTQAVI